MQHEEDKEDNESTSSSNSLGMESAGYHSPDSGTKTPNIDQAKVTTTTTDGAKVENKIPTIERQPSSNMKVLEDRIIALKHEIETLNSQKGEHEHEHVNEQVHQHEQELKSKHDEFRKKLKEISVFQPEFASKENESEVLTKLDECAKLFSDKIEESVYRVQNLETEVDSLRSQYKNFSHQKEQELESLRIQNQEKDIELGKKTKEASDSLEMLKRLTVQSQETESELSKNSKDALDSREILERLTEKLKQKIKNKEGLIEERDALQQQVKDLVVKIESINGENCLSKYENENQKTIISHLQEELQQKDSKISTLESGIEGVKRELSSKMESLEQKYKSLQIDKTELEGKNDVLKASLERKNTETLSSVRATVKKMVEMINEFRKKSEDSVRLLSRRITVAEELHNETRDWYKKTREKNEQDRKDAELALRSIKTMTSTVSDTLSVAETFGLRYVECCEDFTNRVSKVCCMINFVKDWMRVKNGDLVQVKKDFDELVAQMDDKEEEILTARQKVLKLEGKLRDLKKIVKENVQVKKEFDELVVQLDDKEKEILGARQKVLKQESKLRDMKKLAKENDETMVVLKEEKREAIRQLCVWIDYHRGRSDFYKKAFFELVSRYTRRN
ncbi:uncharacterized protein LOC143584349 [Bidens hawaiensis]|uniref:uncharacterized protein LOC143584349 n=1 Tax=Bidens hawaiensis TaxID=980011 RepID=UPI004048F20F